MDSRENLVFKFYELPYEAAKELNDKYVKIGNTKLTWDETWKRLQQAKKEVFKKYNIEDTKK